MKNRLDEVFSVEKLRRAWDGPSEPEQPSSPEEGEEAPIPQDVDAAAAAASYQRLRESIERGFPPGCITTMESLLSDLERLLRQRFPDDPSAAPPRAERAELTLALDGLLNRMEDLLEAFEVGSRR
ncbi:MAG: hypothetical protein ABFD98_16735 [Syntrophobacteraceae bacterium]|nr:hypothetical protein [Desulfobacteraceae bacterium]